MGLLAVLDEWSLRYEGNDTTWDRGLGRRSGLMDAGDLDGSGLLGYMFASTSFEFIFGTLSDQHLP